MILVNNAMGETVFGEIIYVLIMRIAFLVVDKKDGFH